MQTYEAHCGESISHAAEEMVKIANRTGETVTSNFNDVKVYALPGDDPAKVAAGYSAECDRRHKEYIASPEYAQRQRKAQAAQQKKERDLAEALATAPASLTLKDEAAWKEGLAKNQDGYGQGVYRYADKWARIMEAKIAAGEKVKDCADAASHLADDEGITGFMYGAAVNILAHCWIHGEDLRRWHNREYVGEEKAKELDESGGTINPAVLTVG